MVYRCGMAQEVHDRLFIGDIGDASAPPSEIDVVANLSPTWTESTTHWHPLRDGRNDPTVFRAAVWTVLREWKQGNAVLVNCQCGVSRSAAVCASVLRELTGRDWGDCLEVIRAERPAVQPVPGLVDVAVACTDVPDTTAP